jgi:raffinose/stachyose/melibiose transport system substrate-binding protein
LPGVSEILDRAGETLIPGYFNVLANPPLAEGYHGEIAKLFFGEQDAEETLDNIDRMLREVHG